jgi:hypothetical protein
MDPDNYWRKVLSTDRQWRGKKVLQHGDLYDVVEVAELVPDRRDFRIVTPVAVDGVSGQGWRSFIDMHGAATIRRMTILGTWLSVYFYNL